ncbi:permease [Paenibacillus sp. sptzw28]|uniref:permease n=1 Tax=Paenibacillus sp. sptzw28 TaxID=715179 RepID=UPI0021638EA9|nr:permease [Paenibacillus sp. sptzw28]
MNIVYRLGTPLLAVGCLVMLARILTAGGFTDLILASPSLQSFKILFISIILEAFPFILLGVLVSALLQVFVSDTVIARLTPKNPVVGVLFGSLLGLLLPLCECGMIPVVRRLIRKGMPAYIGIVFIFAGPIVNPVVFASTYTAFRSQPMMAYARMGLALAVCIMLGLLLYRFMKKSPLKLETPSAASGPSIHAARHSHGDNRSSSSWRGRVRATLAHASDEFFDIGKYLIIGSLLTALVQTVLDRSLLTSLSDQPLTANIFMMGFAFAISLCSTSDAFVASSFNGIFGSGPLLAFLVFGPMVDLKSTLMLLSSFRVKVVVAVIAFLFAAILIGSMIADKLLFSS